MFYMQLASAICYKLHIYIHANASSNSLQSRRSNILGNC